MKLGHGGKRAGAGKPKGVRWPSTLAKEAARELTRQLVTEHIPELVGAQVAHAKGIKYLVVRAKNGGKFLRVTEAMAKAKEALTDDEEIVEVWEKDPSVQAFTDLMNRAIDKPKEQEQEIKVSGEVQLVDRLMSARKRVST